MRKKFEFFKSHTSAELNRQLHIIWLGSTLRDWHVERIKIWEAMNPTYKVNLWVDSAHKVAIEEQILGSSIVVHDISSVKLSENLSNWMKALVQVKEDYIPNYAALSDIFRLSILNDIGGWYVDTDIEPFSIDTISVHKQLNFHVHAQRIEDHETSLSPAVIASIPSSILTQQALRFLELLALECNTEKYNQMISNRDAFTRMMATHMTTGFAIRAALGKILVNDLAILEVCNPRDSFINDTALFDLLSSYHLSNFEQSWILTRSETPSTHHAISGITIDERYRDAISGKAVLWQQPFLEDIAATRQRAYENLTVTEVSLKGESDLSHAL